MNQINQLRQALSRPKKALFLLFLFIPSFGWLLACKEDAPEKKNISIDRSNCEHRAASDHPFFFLPAETNLALDPSHPTDSQDASVHFDLDGDGEFETETQLADLPYPVKIDADSPSVIEAAVDGSVRPIMIEVVDDGSPEMDMVHRRNVAIEVLTSNICLNCPHLDDYLHDLVLHEEHPDGSPFHEGGLSLLKHHDLDGESTAYGDLRTEALTYHLTTPYSHIDGGTGISGWLEVTAGLIQDDMTISLAETSSVAAQVRAWNGSCDGKDEEFVDVALAVHDLGRVWSDGELRAQIVVFENDITPRDPNFYFEVNNFSSRAGTSINLGASDDGNVLYFERSISLLDSEGQALYLNKDNLGVTVLIEDLTDCASDHPSRCRIINSMSTTLNGNYGQGTGL